MKEEVRLRSQFVFHPFVIVFDSGNVVCVAGTPQKFGGYNGIQCVEKMESVELAKGAGN